VTRVHAFRRIARACHFYVHDRRVSVADVMLCCLILKDQT
jgi:hypothetical protein